MNKEGRQVINLSWQSDQPHILRWYAHLAWKH